jgi:16S rRNA processing protein RimM
MILKEEVFKIGKFTKPHGIKGEIAMQFENDVFDRVDCPYLICLIEGIYVPFFIVEYRFKGAETALFALEDIDNENRAKRLCGKDVFFPRKYYEEDDDNDYLLWTYFIGFKVVDEVYGELGKIKAVDESTINTLFLLDNENEDIIPATQDFISAIDNENQILYLNLPEGLL